MLSANIPPPPSLTSMLRTPTKIRWLVHLVVELLL